MQNPELSILLLDDRRMAVLNRRYLHRDGPTDVISFPMTAPRFPTVQPSLLGDIVISMETAVRQAHACGETIENALARLMTHGILHLIGYDHEGAPRAARAMRAREKKILALVRQTAPSGAPVRRIGHRESNRNA